jgi:hypothetical protein
VLGHHSLHPQQLRPRRFRRFTHSCRNAESKT